MTSRSKSQGGKAQGGKPQRGIALIEALVAILIFSFSFGVLGLIALEASAVNFAVDSEDRNRAALFASDVASAMWTAGSVDWIGNAQLAALNNNVWQVNIGNPATTGLTNGTLNFAAVSANSVDITIAWRPPARATASANSTLTTRVILP
jgi:type IV pilus assembly protein PilV